MLTLSVLLLQLCAATNNWSLAPCMWEEDYASTITSAVTTAPKPRDRFIQVTLTDGMWYWPKAPDYAWVRKEVSTVSDSVGMARLEMGNANAGSYEVVWLVATPTEVHLISNIERRVRTVLPSEVWDRLLDSFHSPGDWKVGSAASFRIDDGTTYYFSLCDKRQGRSVQFAAYALPLEEEVTPQVGEFLVDVSKQCDVVNFMLRLLREPYTFQPK